MNKHIQKATHPYPHPHPLRSNPTMPDTEDRNPTSCLVQDVGCGLKRQPSIRRTNSLKSPVSPQQSEPRLRRANTLVSREAGLPARQQQPVKTDCEVTRQPAFRRPNPPNNREVNEQGKLVMTRKVRFEEESDQPKHGSLGGGKAAGGRRPFSFAVGVDSLPAQDLYLHANTDKQQPNRGRRGDKSRLGRIMESDNDEEQDDDKLNAETQRRLLRSALTMDSEHHAKLITLNNRLRSIAKDLDVIMASQTGYTLMAPMKKLRAIKIRLTDVMRQFRRFPIHSSVNSGNVAIPSADLEQPATEVEQWRELVDIALATIGGILNQKIEGAEKDDALKLDLMHFVEDAEDFVLSCGRNRK